MDILEEHPVIGLPMREEMVGLGEAGALEFLRSRCDMIERERVDPLRYGYRPCVWDVCDDLLCAGVRVVIDGERVKGLGGKVGEVVEARGETILWIAGSQRSSKTEYAGRKCVEVLMREGKTRGWSFADNATKSRAQQQPVVWKYLPFEVRRMCERSGKWRAGAETNVGYNLKTGFTDDSLAIGGSSHWFKNYEQDIGQVEGDQLDIIWLDELRNLELLKTLRFRMGDRGGLIIATFTSINERFSAVDREFNYGAKTLLEVEAPLLPIRGSDGVATGRYELVPRLKRAGVGSDGDLRANIVYFHISDNPYYGWEGRRKGKGSGSAQERFQELLAGAPRDKILSRAYGILTTGAAQQFPLFRDSIHVCREEDVPSAWGVTKYGERTAAATNYLVLDPCSGRNWAMIWVRVSKDDRWWVYREWPSHGHPSAYIGGVGDPGAWATPSSSKYDGEKGPAQSPFGFGLKRYKQEILERERGEEIFERWMDSRYGASPTTQYEGNTTLLEQLDQIGMPFLAASGKSIREGIDLINDKLYYDEAVPVGTFSPGLARLNVPMLMVSERCPNTIFALKEWTGKDGDNGACKDFIDLLRYALLARLSYIGEESYTWRKLA